MKFVRATSVLLPVGGALLKRHTRIYLHDNGPAALFGTQIQSLDGPCSAWCPTHAWHTDQTPVHTHTHTDSSLCQCTLPLSSVFLPHPPCEVYPADCCAQKCVETHPWRRHFPRVSAPLNTTDAHAHASRAPVGAPGAVQLSACIRGVDTRAAAASYPPRIYSRGHTHIVGRPRELLKVSQQRRVTMVTAPPRNSHPQNVNEPRWQIVSISPLLPPTPPHTHTHTPTSVCYYNTHSSRSRIISAVASLLLSLSFHVKCAPRLKSVHDRTHWLQVSLITFTECDIFT